MTWSAVPIRDQDGIAFHAGAPEGADRPLRGQGRWIDASKAPSVAGSPFAKQVGNTLGFTYRSTSLAGAPGYGATLKTWVGSPPRQEPGTAAAR